MASCFLIPLHLEAKELSDLIVHVDCREVGRLYLFLVDEVTFSVPGKGLKLIERDINTVDIGKPIDIVFTELRPGEYALRALVDQNGNKNLKRDSSARSCLRDSHGKTNEKIPFLGFPMQPYRLARVPWNIQ